MRNHVLLLALVASPFLGCSTPIDPVDAGSTPDPVGPLVCEDTSECPDRSICQGGVCQTVGDDGCTTKAECAAGDVCLSGSCGAPTGTCSSSEECPNALVCDGFSRQCVDLNATGCQVANDCVQEPGCAQGCTCEADGSCAPVPAGTDAGPAPVDAGTPPPPLPTGTIDLSGYRIENREHDPPIQVGILPDGTLLSSGQHLVLARNATKAEFESFWGVSFGSDVVYLNAGLSGGGVPNINGDETWALLSPLGTLIDGTPVGAQKNRCWHKVDVGDGTDPGNWAWDNMGNASPGSSAQPSSGVGLIFDQWSDAADFYFEFVQLYYAP